MRILHLFRSSYHQKRDLSVFASSKRALKPCVSEHELGTGFHLDGWAQ
ncbi:hypothetical protein ANCCAN_28924 [Ancylostoma caninum]|uniref:Uncharacterized protein n=1 Tax=Ancylostoma caninum TaxID=29170 RepID=A0A368F376_ANCCA|nr:hypothetical protein ANCCAN_28924 [Ancylostoma caninum]